MNVSIRMISIATTIFWIFLILFGVSAVYSVKDMRFEFGEPQMNVEGNRVTLSLSMKLINDGFYNIGSFNMTAEILNSQGVTIARNSTVVPLVRSGEDATAFLNVSIDQNSLTLQDSELVINAFIGMKIAEVIPVQVSTNFSVSMPPLPYPISQEFGGAADG